MPEAGDEHARDGGATQSPTERAEALVDRLGGRLGLFAGLTALRMRLLAARAREEAEDLWAEAQSIRHGERR